MAAFAWALGAHLAWKPLLIFNAAFLLYVVIRARGGETVPAQRNAPGAVFALAAFLLVGVLYAPSMGANFVHPDWTHRAYTQPVSSVAHLGYFFVVPRQDRFYRPFTFISLWLDHRVFGDRLWGYHLQNIGLHALNAVLAGFLAAGLGFTRWSSRFTALLFGLGAARFEAVVWPGARFDALATLFILVCLLLFLRYWRTKGAVVALGAAVVLAYVAAVLSKEIGYSLVLVLPLLAVTSRLWALAPMERKRAVGLAIPLLASTAVLIAIRFRMYGGIGGYPKQGGRSAQFAFDFRTVYMFLRNGLAAPIFGLNDIPHSPWPLAIAIAFVAVMVAVATLYRGAVRRRMLALMVLTLASAGPVVNLIGWLNVGLENSRYMYWPSLWMCMMLALVFEATRWRMVLAGTFLAVQAAGVLWNEGVYRDMSVTAQMVALEVRRDAGGLSDPLVQFRNVGVTEDGVFAFGTELIARTKAVIPGADVETCFSGCTAPTGTLIYRWDEGLRTMKREQ